MNSRSWGPGEAAGAASQTRGDGSTAGPGSAGEQPGSDRTGSARMVIGMASFMLTLLCVVITVVTWTVNGVAVLGTAFLIVFIWAIGAHRRAFWSD